jgi:hypothetical protein
MAPLAGRACRVCGFGLPGLFWAGHVQLKECATRTLRISVVTFVFMVSPLYIFILNGTLEPTYAQDTRIDYICNSQLFVLLKAIFVSVLQRIKNSPFS